ncbi:MAG: DNA methyltransferase [bacterium]
MPRIANSKLSAMKLPESRSSITYTKPASDIFRLKEQLRLYGVSADDKTWEQEIYHRDWDFADADTKIETHCFHSYPAMMIPQIARELINMYGKKGKVLLDPFCGSGTALVEARIAGLNSWGIDVNPLAIFLSKVKTTPLNPMLLKKHALSLWEKYEEDTYAIDTGKDYFEPPSFFNIDYWFSTKVSKKLIALRNRIESIKDPNIRDFFFVSFSETVREVSNTRNDEFKLYRIPDIQLNNFNPEVFRIFFEKVYRNIHGMSSFFHKCNNKVWCKVIDDDMRLKTKIPEGSIQVIVTSPPYGDSRTTVAYGQFSRLSLQWMGFDWEMIKKIDTVSLGGKAIPINADCFDSKILKRIIYGIEREDPKRAKDVYSFYSDMYKCFEEIKRVCEKGAFVCMVVGNRTVKGIQIPTDRIFVDFGESKGFNHLKTMTRNIPNKRMPYKNSPTNIKGELGNTMNKEHIIILQKR